MSILITTVNKNICQENDEHKSVLPEKENLWYNNNGVFIMKIKKITYDFSVCKVADYSLVNLNAEYCFTGKTDEEDAGYEIEDELYGA